MRTFVETTRTPAYPTILVPPDWTLVRESDKWATVYPLGTAGTTVIAGEERNNAAVFFHVRLMVGHATMPRGLFVCVGHPFILDHLADRIAADKLPWTRTWSALAELRADVTALAVQTLTNWPLDQLDGTTRRLMSRIAGFDDDDGEQD